MKKKLTINTLAFSNLKKHKKQYAVMIIGIILAMVFSSSVLLFLSCMQTSMQQKKTDNYGAQNNIYINADEALFAQAKKNGYVKEYGFAHMVGFGYTDDNSADSGTAIAYFDDKAKELSAVSFVEGTYPQNENEIAIEKAALLRLGIDAEIGESVTLNILVQDGESYLGEPLQKSYTLVGIAKNKQANICRVTEFEANQIPSAFLYDGAGIEIGGKERLICYFNGDYEKVQSLVNDETSGFTWDNWISTDTSMSIVYGGVSDTTEPIAFMVIFVVVLLTASCMGIVNTFLSNLNGRKNQIGMLRTVGATKPQIINLFGREAFIISAICAPISIAISYFLVFAISKILGDGFVFAPNWLVVLASCVFSVVCVMLAALIPLIKISRISPVQSIRNIEYNRKMSRKRIKSYKSFNTAKLLAKRNVSFNRKSQLAVSIILAVTILISCYGFSVVKNYQNNDNVYSLYDYTLRTSGNIIYSQIVNIKQGNNGYSEKDIQKVLSSPYVESVNGVKSCKYLMLNNELSDYMQTINYYNNLWLGWENEITTENIDEITQQAYKDIIDAYGYQEKLVSTDVVAYNSSVLSKLSSSVADGRINIDKINSGEEVIVYAPEEISLVTDDSNFYGLRTNKDDIGTNDICLKSAVNDIKAGDKIRLSALFVDEFDEDNEASILMGERKDREVTVGAVISELPQNFDLEYSGSLSTFRIITSLSAMNLFSADEVYQVINVSLKGVCDDEIDKEMVSLLTEITDNVYMGDLFSDFAFANEQRQFVNSVRLSVLAIVILFLSISASIINNSLSSRIRESKREIGTLRAVGATERELTLSYIRQLFSTFGISYAAGFILYLIVYFTEYIAFKVNDTQMELQFSIWQTIFACAILFAVCSINLWVKIRKEMKNSIIDNIREL